MRLRTILVAVAIVLAICGCEPNISTITSNIGLRIHEQETTHFVVMAQEYTTIPCQKLESEYTRFYTKYRSFNPQPPTSKLVWVSLGSYEALEYYIVKADSVDINWAEAYYSHKTNRVAARNLDSRVITHELAHQLAFNSGIQKRGQIYPIWFSEGLSTNFEQIDSYKTRWEEMNTTGRVIPMSEFIVITDLPNGIRSMDKIHDIYAQSWLLFGYLMNKHPKALKAYGDELSNAPFQTEWSLRQTFIKHFGAKP